MKPEDAEEYTQAVGQVVAGGYRQIALGERIGVPEALGLSTKEWVEQRLGGYVRMQVPERQEAVAELVEEGYADHEIAGILGVGEATVQRDLADLRASDDAEDPPLSASGSDLRASDDAEDQKEIQSPNPAEPPVAIVEDVLLVPIEPGWHQLGEHRLYCGSSTDGEFIEACQGAFAFADPPYNAGKADWDQGFKWQHDYLSDAADIVAVTPGIAALAGFLAETQMPYRWSMAAEITNGMTSGALRFGNWICVTLFAHGSIYRKSKDHVRIPAATGDDAGGTHASRKPLRLLTHLIELFTTKGDTVIDPFLGSGTTLIAAERTGRRCIGAEIDPMHCAEIIARYRGAR